MHVHARYLGANDMDAWFFHLSERPRHSAWLITFPLCRSISESRTCYPSGWFKNKAEKETEGNAHMDRVYDVFTLTEWRLSTAISKHLIDLVYLNSEHDCPVIVWNGNSFEIPYPEEIFFFGVRHTVIPRHCNHSKDGSYVVYVILYGILER